MTADIEYWHVALKALHRTSEDLFPCLSSRMIAQLDIITLAYYSTEGFQMQMFSMLRTFLLQFGHIITKKRRPSEDEQHLSPR